MRMQKPSVTVKALLDTDREWADAQIAATWGSTLLASRGQLHDASLLPGFIAWHREQRLGQLTYNIDGTGCEVVTISSAIENAGAGTALLAAVEAAAQAAGCTRVWLITTNDNLHALGFYQRRGYRLVAVYPGAVDEARRRTKPEIPTLGQHNIPLRDEIELEKVL